MSGARLSDEEMTRLGIPREYWDAIHADTEQSEEAYAEAAQYDNVDEFGLHFSTRLEQHMTPARERTVASFVLTPKDEIRSGVWRMKSELVGETREAREYIRVEAVQGKMLGIVSSDDPDVYVIESGSVRKWVEFIRNNRPCVVKKCYDLTPQKVGNVIVAARAQWLIATPCCEWCLNWLRAVPEFGA